MEVLSLQIPEKNVGSITESRCSHARQAIAQKTLAKSSFIKITALCWSGARLEMPTLSFDVQSESLQSDAVINPKGKAERRRVPLICTSLLYKETLRFFSASKRNSHAQAPKWRGELRARATVTQTAFWRRQPGCGSVNVPNFTIRLEAWLWDGFLLLHHNSDLLFAAFKCSFF